jgi:hypothetical protein
LRLAFQCRYARFKNFPRPTVLLLSSFWQQLWSNHYARFRTMPETNERW